MLSSVTTIRNLFILMAAVALATGCTTAKTLGTSVSAVAATPAPSSDTGTAEMAEATTDTGATESTEAAAPKPWTPHRLKLWVVDEGEHLWGISAHHMVYGDPYQWPILFKRNRHQIEDADLIYPGQVLHIERDLSNAEIDRAIEHAKTRGAWILGITELTDLEYLSRERSKE